MAIHIRRGDYIKFNHKSHGLIKEKYILKEAERLIKMSNFRGITIFTDSPELINFDSFKSLHSNVAIDRGGDTSMVFKRMLNHKGLIASNSTFSLWAGLIGEIKYFSILNIG